MGRSALSRTPAPAETAARDPREDQTEAPKPARKTAASGGQVRATESAAKSTARSAAKSTTKAPAKAAKSTAKAAPVAEPARTARPTASAKPPAPRKRAKRASNGAAGEAAHPAPKARSKPAALKDPPAPEPAETKSPADVASRHASGPSPRAEEAPAHEQAAPDADAASAAKAANPFLTPEVELFAANMAKYWEESGRAMSAYLRPREQAPPSPDQGGEIVDIVKTLGQVAERWMSDPARVAEAQGAFAGGFLELWAGTLKRLSGEPAPPVVSGDPRDARFKDPQWTEHPVFDFLRQAYLHASRWAEKMVEDADDLDPHTRHKAGFYVKLLSNAASPSNFLPTNPELIRETLASKGENLVRGMRMLAEDIAYGKGDLRIRQTDRDGFEVGKNLATTPGKVVFRNDLFELIQYAPATDMARTRPVLIVPPWINKFYILDLTPEKSVIRWCVEQGLTVFCVSWVNPDRRHAAKSFDDYMRDGVMQAVDVAREISGTEQVDAAGYCVGGTLLAVTLAYMAAKGDERIASATFLTTQVDFTHAGDLKVFVDEDQVAAVEARMAETGYLDGSKMANAFNMIRSNDLIWPYVVNNYLRGKAPFPFDLLYWNSDATRMPAANHSFYLRGCYLNNDLATGRMEIMGELLDLKKIRQPVYQLATREDHIAPAKSVFLGAQMFGGPTRFVLAGSGHIAGVVNPPAKMKYQHWVGEEPAGEVADWLAKAEERPGSWWPDWRAWLAAMDATMVAARTPGDGPYPALEDAPGSYVKVRA